MRLARSPLVALLLLAASAAAFVLSRPFRTFKSIEYSAKGWKKILSNNNPSSGLYAVTTDNLEQTPPNPPDGKAKLAREYFMDIVGTIQQARQHLSYLEDAKQTDLLDTEEEGAAAAASDLFHSKRGREYLNSIETPTATARNDLDRLEQLARDLVSKASQFDVPARGEDVQQQAVQYLEELRNTVREAKGYSTSLKYEAVLLKAYLEDPQNTQLPQVSGLQERLSSVKSASPPAAAVVSTVDAGASVNQSTIGSEAYMPGWGPDGHLDGFQTKDKGEAPPSKRNGIANDFFFAKEQTTTQRTTEVRDPEKEPIDPNYRFLGKEYMDALRTAAEAYPETGDWESRYQRMKARKILAAASLPPPEVEEKKEEDFIEETETNVGRFTMLGMLIAFLAEISTGASLPMQIGYLWENVIGAELGAAIASVVLFYVATLIYPEETKQRDTLSASGQAVGSQDDSASPRSLVSETLTGAAETEGQATKGRAEVPIDTVPNASGKPEEEEDIEKPPSEVSGDEALPTSFGEETLIPSNDEQQLDSSEFAESLQQDMGEGVEKEEELMTATNDYEQQVEASESDKLPLEDLGELEEQKEAVPITSEVEQQLDTAELEATWPEVLSKIEKKEEFVSLTNQVEQQVETVESNEPLPEILGEMKEDVAANTSDAELLESTGLDESLDEPKDQKEGVADTSEVQQQTETGELEEAFAQDLRELDKEEEVAIPTNDVEQQVATVEATDSLPENLSELEKEKEFVIPITEVEQRAKISESAELVSQALSELEEEEVVAATSDLKQQVETGDLEEGFAQELNELENEDEFVISTTEDEQQMETAVELLSQDLSELDEVEDSTSELEQTGETFELTELLPQEVEAVLSDSDREQQVKTAVSEEPLTLDEREEEELAAATSALEREEETVKSEESATQDVGELEKEEEDVDATREFEWEEEALTAVSESEEEVEKAQLDELLSKDLSELEEVEISEFPESLQQDLVELEKQEEVVASIREQAQEMETAASDESLLEDMVNLDEEEEVPTPTSAVEQEVETIDFEESLQEDVSELEEQEEFVAPLMETEQLVETIDVEESLPKDLSELEKEEEFVAPSTETEQLVEMIDVEEPLPQDLSELEKEEEFVAPSMETEQLVETIDFEASLQEDVSELEKEEEFVAAPSMETKQLVETIDSEETLPEDFSELEKEEDFVAPSMEIEQLAETIDSEEPLPEGLNELEKEEFVVPSMKTEQLAKTNDLSELEKEEGFVVPLMETEQPAETIDSEESLPEDLRELELEEEFIIPAMEQVETDEFDASISQESSGVGKEEENETPRSEMYAYSGNESDLASGGADLDSSGGNERKESRESKAVPLIPDGFLQRDQRGQSALNPADVRTREEPKRRAQIAVNPADVRW